MDEQEKNKRLYLEIRYARDSSVTTPKWSSIFRLKRELKNLQTAEYVENLVLYLNRVTANTNALLNNLKCALDSLM